MLQLLVAACSCARLPHASQWGPHSLVAVFVAVLQPWAGAGELSIVGKLP